MSKLESKIKNMQVFRKSLCYRGNRIHAPDMTEVNPKSGVVPVTDSLLGDDTGEIRVVGWRNQDSSINKLNVGDRIKVIGATGNNGREVR